MSTPQPQLDPPVPAQWRNVPASNPSTAATDERAWWKAFGDARLDALIEQALHDNLDIAQAVERLRAARLLDHHASDRFLPTLRARTDDAIDPDASASFFIIGFDALWELGLFGQRSAAEQIVRAQFEGARISLHAARVSLVAEVTRNWIELRSAQHQEAAQSRMRDAAAEKLRLLRIREKLALISPQELARAEAELAQADASLAEPRRTMNACVRRLAVLAGRNEPDPAWLESGPQPLLGEWRLTSIPADLLRTRPEIAGAEADVLRAAGELGVSRAQIYPYIGLRAAIQWSTDITSYRRTTSRGILSLGPVIDIPLFDWGNRVANAHARGHELKASVLAYRQAVLNGVAEVETALGDLEHLREREAATARASLALSSGVAAVRVRVDLGLDSPIELHERRIENERSGLALLEARAARDLAYVSLYKALGGAPMPAVAEQH